MGASATDSGSTPGAAATLAHRLRGARRRSFVGRAAEVALFREALAADEPPVAVLWLFGPGGVGKSTLVGAFAEVAAEMGRDPVLLDLRGLEPSPGAFEAELARHPATATQQPVLLLDTFERAVGLEDWLRDAFLPTLPAGAITVVASRSPPGPAWRRDPGWRELLRVISLRNLDREDARRLLADGALDEALHERVLDVTHGHPLALALLLDAVSQDGRSATVDLAGMPDVVATLMAGFVDGVPGAGHRLALAAAAQARFTTAALMRRITGESDGDALFTWLRGLSFMDATPQGLCPHDLARDVIDADLRWRDPEAHADVHGRVREFVVDAIRSGRADQGAIADLVFLHRSNPAAPSMWDWASLGRVYAEPMRPADRPAILDMVRRHEGDASAAIAAHWIERRPGDFTVFREHGSEPVGFIADLELHDTTEEDRAPDPGTVAAWAHAERHAPVRPGDEVVMARLFMDAEAYQDVSRSLNVVTILSTRRWVSSPRLAWYYLAVANLAVLEPMMAYIHFERASDADFEVGGRRYAVFGRDWRREDGIAWLERMAERELATDAPPPAPPEMGAPDLALGRREFAEEVRRALRELHRPDVLAASPLARSRLMRGQGASLRELIEEAIGTLGEHPRTSRLARAVHCTYVRPAPTQEAAAELLGLPFSTYRGHLTRGIDSIVDLLWERELYGN